MLIPKYKNFKQEHSIGEHIITLPDPPAINKIAYHNLPQEKQYFHRTYLQSDWKNMDISERNKFATEEWRKRMEGFWFMNNGNIEYMTGRHYMYNNWWKLSEKATLPKEFIEDARDLYYPFFTDADRDWFYLEKYCDEDSRCCGFVDFEGRRSGKTYKSISVIYEKVSRTPNSQGGIQSRNDADAKKVYNKLIYGWRWMPAFFKPVDTGETRPASQLVFDEPRKRDTKTQVKENSQVLSSFIDYENAYEGAYDGTRQLINFQDEVGKITNEQAINLLERIRVVRECVMVGSSVVGKIIATSTVEEMEKGGGAQAKELWDRSTILDETAGLRPDLYKIQKGDTQVRARNKNGFTLSGLYRYFKPDYYGSFGDKLETSFINRYGYSDTERANKILEQTAEVLQGADLASFRRKHPTKETHLFISDSRKAMFDIARIDQQLQYNETLPRGFSIGEIHYPIRGNFIWRDGIKDGEVLWIPADEGKWLISWLPRQGERNKKSKLYEAWKPLNSHIGVFGLDPYDANLTVSERKSKAACYGLLKYDPVRPYTSGIPIAEYINRTPEKTIMYEDILMACIFYGWEILIERNKSGASDYFEQRGYYHYMMMQPVETHTEYTLKNNDKMIPGIAMTGDKPRQALIDAVESFVFQRVGIIRDEHGSESMGMVFFQELLLQLKDYEFGQKWTKYDAMVGFGLALLGSRNYIPTETPQEAVYAFPEYSTSTTNSTPTSEISFKTGKGRINPILKTAQQREQDIINYFNFQY